MSKVGALTLLLSPHVDAYCRATSCDPAASDCATDDHGCAAEGPPVFWKDARIRLSVDADGSALRGISGSEAFDAVGEALSAWTNAECDAEHAHPSIDALVGLGASGLTASFEQNGENQSVVLYRDELWPYGATAVAKTTLGLDFDSGEILDADVQLNSDDYDLGVDADAGQIDVVAVLTHELGHVLGLGHSDVPGATMQPEASGFGTTALRTLEPDDVAGICAIYPPEPPSPAAGDAAAHDGPEALRTGCSIGATSGGAPSPFAVALGLAVLWRSRRRARP